MVDLSLVSETALITLKSRAVETAKANPLIHDPRSVTLIDALRAGGLSDAQLRILEREPPAALSSYIALRARKYDAYAMAFLEDHPHGLIVNLGAGFDTRYWRIPVEAHSYRELDLPEVVALKRDLLGDALEYEYLGCSVLDEGWIDQLAAHQTENILFLAEGLLMYLPEQAVIHWFKQLASRFSRSQIVFEVVHRKYTRGFRKKIVESKMMRRTGTQAGTSYNYGVSRGSDIEAYAANITVREEWSHFDDPDIRPRFLRIFRHIRSFARTQWTIHASIE